MTWLLFSALAASSGIRDTGNAFRLAVTVYPTVNCISEFLLCLLDYLITFLLPASLSLCFYAYAIGFILAYINLADVQLTIPVYLPKRPPLYIPQPSSNSSAGWSMST